jgi:hypothetical protein
MAMKDRSISPFLIIVAVWLVVHLALFWIYGLRHLHDADYYVAEGAFFIRNGSFNDTNFFYFIPVLLLGICTLFGPMGVPVFLVFQCCLSLAACFALYRSAALLFKNGKVALAVPLIFLLWWDNIHWNITTMSESVFCSLICFTVYALVQFRGKTKDFLLIGTLTILTLLSRPTGVIVAAACGLFFLTWYRRQILGNKTILYGFAAIATIAFFALVYGMAHSYDLEDQYARGNIVTYMDLAEGKVVYRESVRLDVSELDVAPEQQSRPYRMYYFITHNPAFLAKMAFWKIAYLVTGFRPYYSLMHNLFTACWLVFIYVLFFFGIRKSVNLSLNVFIIAIIFLNCIIVGFSTIDWDNRFYIPMEPGIVLMAGAGLFLINFRFLRWHRD